MVQDFAWTVIDVCKNVDCLVWSNEYVTATWWVPSLSGRSRKIISRFQEKPIDRRKRKSQCQDAKTQNRHRSSPTCQEEEEELWLVHRRKPNLASSTRKCPEMKWREERANGVERPQLPVVAGWEWEPTLSWWCAGALASSPLSLPFSASSSTSSLPSDPSRTDLMYSPSLSLSLFVYSCICVQYCWLVYMNLL